MKQRKKHIRAEKRHLSRLKTSPRSAEEWLCYGISAARLGWSGAVNLASGRLEMIRVAKTSADCAEMKRASE